MFAILYALGMFLADLFKERCRLEAENLLLRPCQHGWADIDADDFGLRWVKLDVTTCSDPRIQYPPREALEEQGPYRAIAAILKGEIKQVIERRREPCREGIGDGL
jgi:hypothetical protein